MPSQGEPRSASVSSSMSSLTSCGAGAAGLSSWLGQRKPDAMARVTMVASPKPIDIAISVMPASGAPNSRVGSIKMPSPQAPPSPVGKGQDPLRGSVEAKAAARKVAAIQTSPRHFSPSGRCARSRQPSSASGNSSSTEARPSNCIARSEKMAPGKPSRFLIGVCVAWLSEGSCTDQVASAITPSSAQVISASPASSLKRRRTMSRK